MISPDAALRTPWERATHALAYAFVIGAGLLVGRALGTVVAILAGLIPIRC